MYTTSCLELHKVQLHYSYWGGILMIVICSTYESFQAWPPFMLNFFSLPKNMTTMRITLPLSDHFPENPYILFTQRGSELSCRSQLYPVVNPTFPYALQSSPNIMLIMTCIMVISNYFQSIVFIWLVDVYWCAMEGFCLRLVISG